MILRIDHVSIAVRDFKRADDFFTTLLGLVPGGAGTDGKSKFFFQVYSSGDLSRFEIITPTEKGSFLDGFLKTRSGGVHHITCQVNDIKETRKILDEKKIPYFGYNDSYENWKELFIHPSDAFGVLIQFAEFNPHEWIDGSQAVAPGRKWEVKNTGVKALLSLLHPGGGKVNYEYTSDELDLLINDLVQVRKALAGD